MIKQGDILKHYKGEYYKVLDFATSHIDGTAQMVYQESSSNKIFVMPRIELYREVEPGVNRFVVVANFNG